jgi:hypothetical protein
MLFDFIAFLAGQLNLEAYTISEVLQEFYTEVEFFKLKIERNFNNKESKKLAGKELIIEGNFFKEDDPVTNGVSANKIVGRKPADFIVKIIPALLITFPKFRYNRSDLESIYQHLYFF